MFSSEQLARTQNKQHQKNSLINYLKNLDYKLIRNLPLYEMQKIIKRKSELCNWCGIEKKIYFCCDKACIKKDFMCAQCSIEWIEYPHFQHQFIYIIPMLTHKLLGNQEAFIKSYISLQEIEIKTKFYQIKELSTIYSQIQKELEKLKVQKRQIQTYLAKVQKIMSKHESKLGELTSLVSNILEIVGNAAIKERSKKYNALRLFFAANQSQITSRNSLRQIRQSHEDEGRMQVQIQELITSQSRIFIQPDGLPYPLVSRFFSDNMKGLSVLLPNFIRSEQSINCIHLLNNVASVRLTGQISLKNLLMVLSNYSLKCLQLDYITMYSSNKQEGAFSYEKQESAIISEDIILLGSIRKFCSNLVTLKIHYPSVNQILSLLHLCSFPQISRLDLQQIYQPENVLKSFLKQINIRLPKLQHINFSTYLDKAIVLKIIEQTINVPHSFSDLYNRQDHRTQPQIGLPHYKKKRYHIKCMDHINVMLREIRLDQIQANFPLNDPNHILTQDDNFSIFSLGYWAKTKTLLILAEFYRKKNIHVSKNVIDSLLYNDIL